MSDNPFARRTPFDANIAAGNVTIRVRYRTDMSTNPAYQAAQAEAAEGRRTGKGDPQRILARLVSQMIEAWDAVDDRDTPYPITEEALYALPQDVLLEIMRGITAATRHLTEMVRLQQAPEHMPPPVEPQRN